MATKTKITKKAAKKAAKKVVAKKAEVSPISQLWEDQEFRSKMVKQGQKTMSGLWAKRGFRKAVKEGMKSRWANPEFRAMMVQRMKEARAAKTA